MSPPSSSGATFDTGLWLDAPDAMEAIARRRALGTLAAEEDERLRSFVEQGFLTLRLDDDAPLDALLEDVETLWRTRPGDVAFACDSPPRPMSEAATEERRPSYRLHDIHSHSAAALGLYLYPEIYRWIRLILDQEPVAIQSLFFEWGSQQLLHRDPVVVPTGRPGHLVAAWIALEDIHPDSGALCYVPGSHRYPYFEFAPGEHMLDGSRTTPQQVEAALAWDEDQCRRLGLEPRLFTPKKGELLIWHASLRHGGGPLADRSRTRRSFVVHYSTRASYRSRANTVLIDGEPRILDTHELLEVDGRAGFDNPARAVTGGLERGPP
ncbi:MAG TPA: phytanoyl-CoA dioxygenase family protein [Thermoanaerobaculia bacterium]|nr:phytanoyl-CoA dioxygenase family protein [Thermoanaerobaculia bacterium]